MLMNVVKNAPMTVKVRKRKLAEIATDEEPPSGEYPNNPFALPRFPWMTSVQMFPVTVCGDGDSEPGPY